MTADLVESFGWFQANKEESTAETQRAQRKLSRNAETALLVAGALCLVLPLVEQRELGAYLFGLVWLGFVFFLDPVNARLGEPSLIADLAAGRSARFWSLLISGWVCGWLWEFWNFWAEAKWVYIFPIFQGWKIFEMPVPGYLGFLPFALECFVMYVFASHVLGKVKRKR